MPDVMLLVLYGYLMVGVIIAVAMLMRDPPGRCGPGDLALYVLSLIVAVLLGPAVALFGLMRRG